MDEIPLSIEPWLLPIHNVIEEVIHDKAEQARKDAEREARRHR